jgi:hypothetical protein
MTISFTTAELARLNYNSVIFGIHELANYKLSDNYSEASKKVDRLEKKLASFSVIMTDGVRRYFREELNVDKLTSLVSGLKLGTLDPKAVKRELPALLIERR